MYASIKFSGMIFRSVRSAAEAWVDSALPDVSVIDADEDPIDAAEELEAFCWAEAEKIDDALPEGTDEDSWRKACRTALVTRIESARCG